MAAVTYGFFNWIGPFLVTELGSENEERSIILAVLIFASIGIPILFVKVYFLFALVMHWMEHHMSLLIRIMFGILGLVTITLYLIDTRRFIQFDIPPPLYGNIFWIGVFSVGIQVLIMLFPFLVREKAYPALKSLRMFCAVNLICFSAYTAIAYTQFLHLAPFFYYLLLLPPLIFILLDFKNNPPPPLTDAHSDRDAVYAHYGLTSRERQIVDLLLLGRNNRQMAKTLFLSVQSIKNALTRIYRKTGVPSRSALISRVAGLDGLGKNPDENTINQ